VHQRSDPSPRSTNAAPSLFRLARREADRHKWIESEKAGCDLGDAAIEDWSRRYWRQWSRERWLEHLSGVCRWSELPEGDFGLLQREFHANGVLLGRIVERIKRGGENLDIIAWVLDEVIDLEDAIAILTVLDINSARLSFRLG